MNDISENKNIEVDFLQLLRTVGKNAKYILISTVILGLIGLLYSSLFMTPIYQASAKMIVNSRIDGNQNITNDQINSAKNLVKTYSVIIRSRTVLEPVIEELGLEESYASLAERVSVDAVDSTQVMQITVYHPNRETAEAVSTKILEIAPAIIMNTVEAGSVKTVERAYSSDSPVSPNVMRNTVLAAVVGCFLSCCVIVVVFLLDNTFKSELDIQNQLNLPVLGVIPSVESCSSASGYGKQADPIRKRR